MLCLCVSAMSKDLQHARHIISCLEKSRTPVVFIKNFIKTVIISMILGKLGIKNLHF